MHRREGVRRAGVAGRQPPGGVRLPRGVRPGPAGVVPHVGGARCVSLARRVRLRRRRYGSVRLDGTYNSRRRLESATCTNTSA